MWDEIVSKNPTRIIKETYIHNLADEIIKLQNKNKITVEFFANTQEYEEKIKKHIKNLKKYSIYTIKTIQMFYWNILKKS